MAMRELIEEQKKQLRYERAVAAASKCYMLIYFRYTFKDVSISETLGAYVSGMTARSMNLNDPKVLAQYIAESAMICYSEHIGLILAGVNIQKDKSYGYLSEKEYRFIDEKLNALGMDEKSRVEFLTTTEGQTRRVLKNGFKDVQSLAEYLTATEVMPYAEVRKVLAHVSLTTEEALEYMKGNLKYITG